MRQRARTGTFPVLVLSLACLTRPLDAQYVVRTWLPWRTVETERFVFHFPTELEAWTRAVASRADAIDSAVARLVGYAPSKKTQVVVDDPFQVSNGMAWPFLDRPTISLWATPPNPRDDIGEYRTWGEMLVTHEFAHIAHLTRPTRNRTLAALMSALPVQMSPMTLRTPRWAFEGYATFVEGRVTGSGRPHAAWRAAMLRQWALEGQLPRYEQLNAGGGYEGGSFAYLAGSAFLEWLAERRGDSSLVLVWRRLSARQNRSFDAAFAGVYGETPGVLYARFAAELVGTSLEVERRVASPDTGAIVQRLARSTGDPAISPDGRRVALVIRSATAPSRVVVWSTAPEPDTLKARRDSALLRADPEDVPARTIYPPPKRALATLRARGGSPFESPRFLRDGRVLLWRATPRGNGAIVADMYLWDPAHGSTRRVTRAASVRDGDPLPDGTAAIATRCRGGWCDLVRVNLENGDVTTLIEASDDRSFFRPRVSPNGETVLVAVHRGGRWRLATVELASRAMTIVDPDDGANRYDGSWLNDHEILATSDRGGIANIERIDIGARSTETLTSVTGAAVAPESNRADGSVWFLSLYSRGYDVRRLATASPRQHVAALPLTPNPDLAPALSPRPAPRAAFAERPLEPSRRYGLTPRLFRWIPQPSFDADGASGGLSFVSRDIVGRSELTASFAAGDASTWRGGSLTGSWLGMRPAVRAHLFAASQSLSRTRAPLDTLGLDVALRGVSLALDNTFSFDTWAARYRVGGSTSSLTSQRDSLARDRLSANRTLAFADAGLAFTQRGINASLTESLAGNFTGGRSFAAFQRGVTSAGLSLSGRAVPTVALSALYGRVNRDAPLVEQFTLGGGPSLLIDRTLLAQRVAMPALPLGIRTGSSVMTYRAALGLPLVSAYYWAGTTSIGAERFANWNRVVGLEWNLSIPAVPAAGTPAARAQIGLGESLDAPFRRRLRAYASVVLNP